MELAFVGKLIFFVLIAMITVGILGGKSRH